MALKLSPAADAISSNIGLISYGRVTSEMRRIAPSITAGQMQTFIAIVRGGRRSQIEISEVTGFTRQATSRHVTKLVSIGLLIQRRGLEDGRCRAVRLSALGRFISAALEASQRELLIAHHIASEEVGAAT